MRHSFLAHRDVDDVAVAIRDVEAGEDVVVAWLDGDKEAVLRSAGNIPLGHKIALRDLNEGSPLLKYGIPIGRTTRPVRAGDHVHTHNLKSARW